MPSANTQTSPLPPSTNHGTSIRRYMISRTYLGVFLVFLAALVWDIEREINQGSALEARARAALTDLILAQIQTPLIMGNFPEVQRQAQSMSGKNGVFCTIVTLHQQVASDCPNKTANTTNPRIWHEKRTLHYPGLTTPPIGHLEVRFHRAGLSQQIMDRALHTALTYFALCLFLLAIFSRVTSKIVQEAASVLASFTKEGALPATAEKLSLWEFRAFAQEATKASLELQEASWNKAVSEAVHMLAHDVRKPFSSLKLMLQTLESANTSDEIKFIARTFAPVIKNSCDKTTAMLNDLLEVGSPKLNNVTPLNILALIKESFNEASITLNPNQVRLSLMSSYEPVAELDPIKFGRVLTNIFTNAIQAMAGQGRITVRCQPIIQGGQAFSHIAISNSGPAIPDGILPRLFDMYFTSGKKNGSGLGLAISKKIVEMHGGSISCRNDEKYGVTFSLLLPRECCHSSHDLTQFTPPATHAASTFAASMSLAR